MLKNKIDLAHDLLYLYNIIKSSLYNFFKVFNIYVIYLYVIYKVILYANSSEHNFLSSSTRCRVRLKASVFRKSTVLYTVVFGGDCAGGNVEELKLSVASKSRSRYCNTTKRRLDAGINVLWS